jgi:hypothetical protein
MAAEMDPLLGMEPMTRDQMLGMCEAVIEQKKRETASRIIREIYQGARIAASNGEKKYTRIQQWVIDRATTVAGQQNITFDSVREYIMAELHRLFPGCKVEYVERRPDDIFGPLDRRRRPATSPHSDGIDRAIIVDWS